MKYTQKPVEIEAAQWFPPGHEKHDPSMLSHRKGNSVNPPDYLQNGDLFASPSSDIPGFTTSYFVKTARGNMRVFTGDWIITRNNGERCPCDPDTFESFYEPIPAK